MVDDIRGLLASFKILGLVPSAKGKRREDLDEDDDDDDDRDGEYQSR